MSLGVSAASRARTVAAANPTSTPTAADPKSVASPAPGGAMGKDQFLQLLVTQMKNQDPLNPMDGTQMASQLAQFSTVEQLESANTTLTQIAAAIRVANGTSNGTSNGATNGTATGGATGVANSGASASAPTDA